MSAPAKVRRDYHTKDGAPVPGVTTVIKNLGWNTEQLLGWANKVGRAGQFMHEARNKAADVGTLGHALIEAHVLGQSVDAVLVASPLSDEDKAKAERALEAYLQWTEAHVVVPYATEVEIVSEVHRVGGTIDLIARVDGVMCLIDHKTGRGIYPESLVQVATYREIFMEVRDETIESVIVLHVSAETGDFKAHVVAQPVLDAGFATFVHCRALHELKAFVALADAPRKPRKPKKVAA